MPPVTLCTLEKSLTEVKKFAIIALRGTSTNTLICRRSIAGSMPLYSR